MDNKIKHEIEFFQKAVSIYRAIIHKFSMNDKKDKYEYVSMLQNQMYENQKQLNSCQVMLIKKSVGFLLYTINLEKSRTFIFDLFLNIKLINLIFILHILLNSI